MAYITYEEYVELGGMLDAASFTLVEVKAEGVVNWYTFNRLANDETFKPEVKKCMAQLIDLLDVKIKAFSLGQASGSVVASQSNDGVSISYNTLGASDAIGFCDNETKQIIESWLYNSRNEAGVPIMYRGVSYE